jgi:hypothetical protein
MKGQADFGAGSRFHLHTVGGFVQLERSAWPSGAPHRTELVLIGAGIDTGAVLAELEGCVAPDPSVVDERGLLHILRYLP